MSIVECFVCFDEAEDEGVADGIHHYTCEECGGPYGVVDDPEADNLRRFVATMALHDFFEAQRAEGVERPVVTLEILKEFTVS